MTTKTLAAGLSAAVFALALAPGAQAQQAPAAPQKANPVHRMQRQAATALARKPDADDWQEF